MHAKRSSSFLFGLAAVASGALSSCSDGEPGSGVLPGYAAPGDGQGAEGTDEGGNASGADGSSSEDAALPGDGSASANSPASGEGGEASDGMPDGASLPISEPGRAEPGGSSGGGTGVEGPLFEPGSAPRLMIVGDSISAGPGCYKGALLDELTANGYADFAFVGQYGDDCGRGVMHSAVSCSTAQQYTQESFTLPNCFEGQTFPGMATLMATHQPDLVMLQLGVNDVWSLRSVDAILADYSALVAQARAQNPSVVALVAQIHQVRPDCTNEAVFNRAAELVTAVPAWAEAQSTEASPVLVADLWTNSDWNEADDCVHPNAVGAERMGHNWYEALSPLLPH